MTTLRFIQSVELKLGTFFFLTLAIAFGCGSANEYSGDGKLIDNGIFAADDRYVLDLGSIPLRKSESRTYRLENLPSTPFVIGIDVESPPSSFSVLEKKPIHSSVSILLTGPDGKALLTASGEVTSWTWSIPSTGQRAFIYKEGVERSSFTPAANTRYELKIEILKPDSSTVQYEARIKAKSGGWK